ncbi:hypothetical protein DDB_G0292908 [Dictyostelium discoideum AX4]|uniref:Ubiquitin-like domain-containing protein n=1 Tax=Dictyostelium discoideum TaxID=44689 RepID=Q54CI0_DICDI|nr:hypothetical protein DDB_G0292908 [Dictyostelium discoideum AX4]EAL61003.1 hypothetical protein DDB_G0292908 [Dictyostelium discoideum AX4]|eukprot:XP_629436.1 hypothetical protein DDB_G0292908 [Dictyostelium discoideum AX4]
MQIFVKKVGNSAVSYEFKETDTIERVKAVIEGREGVPIDQQTLSFLGKKLENGRTLGELKIQPGSTINLSLRLRGGN